MRVVNSGRAAGVLATLAAISLALAAPALAQKPGAPVKKKAAKPGKIRTGTATQATTNDGQLVSAIATCPGKTRALSGGFRTDYANDFLEVYESRRVTPNSWRVSVARDSANPTGINLNVTAYVYCRSKLPKMPEGSATRVVAAGAPAQGSATASCPGNNKAVSGGFAYNPPAFGIATEDPAQHYESFRSSPNAWTATFENVVGGFGRQMTSYVYCRKGKQLSGKTATQIVPAGSGPVRVGSGSCTDKLAALAGGYRASPPTPSLNAAAPLVTSSVLAGKSWEASAASILGAGTITVFGFCG
jgi:hypothetical protein